MPDTVKPPHVYIEMVDVDLPLDQNPTTFQVTVEYDRTSVQIELVGAKKRYGPSQEVDICRHALLRLAEAIQEAATSPSGVSWRRLP